MNATINDIIHRVESNKQSARDGGGQKRIADQHNKGKLTARERLEK